jgi:hypothetical protein
MTLFLLICCHFFSGYGLLDLFNIRQKPLVMLPLALLSGIAVASCVPFLLQLAYCPLYPATVFGALGLSCLLLNMRGLARGYGKWPRISRSMVPRLRIRLYELPFILILSFLIFVSVWRCYYQPPVSRDALSGPEAIAEYAVREHTLINSFFTVELSTTNNQFKSPFLISLQVIYKMAGYPFGQIWLSIVFISYTLLFYQVLKTTLHPILAGSLLLLMTATPEIYAYTFMILYDYSNMVFLFLSLYFLIDSFENKRRSYFYFAALLMGIATYIRSETLVLAVLFTPMLWLRQRRERQSPAAMVWTTGVFILPALLSYYLSITLYINHYLPVHYDISALVNPHPFNLRPLFKLYGDIFKELMISEFGVQLWGYIMFVWAGIFLAELVILRRFTRTARNWLYAIGVVFAGLGLLGFLLPMFNLFETTKRGLFKIVPLMVMYMANSQLLIRLSARISQWEQGRYQ